MSQDLKMLNVIPVTEKMFDAFVLASQQGITVMPDATFPNGQHALSSYKYIETLINDPTCEPLRDLAAMFTNAGIAFAGLTVTGVGVLLAPFGSIAAFFVTPFLGKMRTASILIANGLPGNLTLKESYIDCGLQTAKPTGSFNGKTLNDVIPGRQEPLPGQVLKGVGFYRFEKDLSLGFGVYGTGGALSFTCDAPGVKNTFAISWFIPEGGAMGVGVTIDLGAKYSSLKDFYLKTAGANSQSERVDSDTASIIHGTLWFRKWDEGDVLKIAKMFGMHLPSGPVDQSVLQQVIQSYTKTIADNDGAGDDMVLTVSIRPL
jgi:hypothetical protein